MAVYMIDYENVKTGGLNGISRLTETDRVIIFYSENANRLTFDLHQRLMASTAQIEYREVSVGGHNALDFQLVTYLGFLIAQEPNGQYLIISNDRGFEYVVNFWRKDGLSIGLLPYLKDPAYALQKALRPDTKPVEAPSEAAVSEEPAENAAQEPLAEPVEAVAVPSPEPVAEAEPAAREEPAAQEPVAEAPVETVFEETVPATAPAAEVKSAEPVATPVEILPERRKASQRKKGRSSEKPEAAGEPANNQKQQSRPKKQNKPAEQPQPRKQSPAASAPQEEESAPEKPAETLSASTRAELRAMLGDAVADDPELRFVLSCVEKYKTKLGLNNALVKRFGNQKASEIYQKLKPMLSAKKASGTPSNPKQPKKEKEAVS